MISKALTRVALIASLSVLGALSFSQDDKAPKLKAGDTAPSLKIKKWVQGTPIPKIEKGKVYVFEFWATWCGPCIANMPHLSELAKKYEGKVTITGVDVWEDNYDKNTDPAVLVELFMKKNPGRMTYNVCIDDKNAMGNSWLKAAGQNGIPSSFIIDREGKIAWIGHPYYMEPILEKVVDGTFNLATYTAEQKALKDAEAAKDAPNLAILKPLEDAAKAKNYSKVLELAAKIEKEHPDLAPRVLLPKLDAMSGSKNDKAIQEMFQKSLEAPKPDGLAVVVVLRMVEMEGFRKETFVLASKYLEDYAARNQAEKNIKVLHLQAQVFLKSGEYDKAIATSQKAVDLGVEEKMLDSQLKSYRDFLEKAKAEKASKGG